MSTLMPSQIEQVGVRQISEPMFQHATRVISEHSRSMEEFDQFMAMLTPDPWRCAYCDKHFVTPTLARDCETTHERNTR